MAILKVSDFSGQITPDVVKAMILSQASDYPITAMLLNGGRTKRTGADVFSWYKDGLANRRDQINNGGSAYTSGTTALVVDDGTKFSANDVVISEATGEVMLVTAVSTNTLTVVRGLGTVVAAHANSVANDVWLLNCGKAMGEGFTAPAAIMAGQTKVENGIQIFAETIEMTGTASRLDTLTEDQRAFQRMKKFHKFMRDHEHALLHGDYETSEADAGSLRVRTTRGLIKAVTTNIYNPAGTITIATFEDNFCAPLFQYVSNGEKIVFAGATLVSAIHALYRGKVTIENGQTDVGLKISRVLSAYGEFSLVHHKAMIGGFAGSGIGANVESLVWRHTEKEGDSGLPQLKENIQANDSDTKKDMWRSEGGLEYGDELNHAYIKGVTGAA